MDNEKKLKKAVSLITEGMNIIRKLPDSDYMALALVLTGEEKEEGVVETMVHSNAVVKGLFTEIDVADLLSEVVQELFPPEKLKVRKIEKEEK